MATVSHSGQHTDANDAIEALQAKVGVDSSAVTTSLDYRVAQLELGGGGGASVTVSDTAPSSPSEGDLWFESDTGDILVYYGSAWVDVGGTSVANIAVQSTAPTSPVNGDLWFDTDTAQTFVWYDDGTSTQWVEVGAASAAASGSDGFIQFASGGALSSNPFLNFDSSNVRLGVGVTTPGSTLTVGGDISSTGLTVDTDTLHVDSTNNRVGIGTTTPTSALEVVGNVYADTGKVIVNRANADTSTTKGGIDFQIDGSTYAQLHQPSALTLQTDGDFNVLGSLRTKGKKTGLVLVGSASFSNVLSAEFRTAFTTDFDNYQLHLSNVTGGAQEWIYFRGWFGSTLLSTNSYDNQRMYGHITSVGAQKDQQISYGKFLPMGGNPTSFVVNISSPMKSGAYTLTTAYGLYSDNGTLGYVEINNTFVRSTAQMDGMRFGGVSGSSIFSGRWELYGCPK